MSALGANRTRRDGGNDVNDPSRKSRSKICCDAQHRLARRLLGGVRFGNLITLSERGSVQVTWVKMVVSCCGRVQHFASCFRRAVEPPNAVRVKSLSIVRSGLGAAGVKVRKASVCAAQVKCRARVGAGWPFGTSLASGGRWRRKRKPGSSRRRMLTLALLLAAALLGDPASAKDKTAGPDGDRQDAIQSEIRLGMSADFSESARALSIELYRGAMAYLLPLNKAGGGNGRRVVIRAYDDRYEPDLAIRNTLKLMAEDDVFALFSYVGTPTMN